MSDQESVNSSDVSMSDESSTNSSESSTSSEVSMSDQSSTNSSDIIQHDFYIHKISHTRDPVRDLIYSLALARFGDPNPRQVAAWLSQLLQVRLDAPVFCQVNGLPEVDESDTPTWSGQNYIRFSIDGTMHVIVYQIRPAAEE